MWLVISYDDTVRNSKEILYLIILYDTVRRSNEILCLIISYNDTVQQQWDSLSHYLIWHSTKKQRNPSLSWFHMMKMCTSNDGLSVSHNLTLWHSVARMRFFVSWFDMITECSRMRSFVVWFGMITQCSNNETLSHYLIWHNAATMRSFVSWSHIKTVQQQLHLVFPMISYDDRVSQACCSRLKRTYVIKLYFWRPGVIYK